MHKIELELGQRILILDGAMGTMIQDYNLKETDYRNGKFSQHPVDLKGNFDMLNLTKPAIIKNIHLQYLQAGADIISTNTFGSNSISQDDYQTADWVYDLNYEGAVIAKEAVAEIQKQKPHQTFFVAGAMGPTTKLASMSPDFNNPGFRAVAFDQLIVAYTAQAKALIAGGVDLFLLETITDTLNAKAALFALMELFESTGKKYPIMVSGTITDASGRILSGQTVEAFLISISHAPILSVGLNCALGAAELRPYIEVLDKVCKFYVSTHPNAGLPNQFGAYDQSAEELANLIAEFANNGWLNIVGGCCGTTPLHIKAISTAVKYIKPRQKNKTQVAYPISNKITDAITGNLIENWFLNEHTGNKPTFSMTALIQIISKINDEAYFFKLKSAFEKEKKLYHPEQALLLNAHIIGRQQYFRANANQ